MKKVMLNIVLVVTCIATLQPGVLSEQQSNATCDAFEEIISDRNTVLVSNCELDSTCTGFTCDVELSFGETARVTITATPCSFFDMEVSSSFSGSGGFSRGSSKFRGRTSLRLRGSDYLRVEADGIEGGLNFEVTLSNSDGTTQLFPRTDVPLKCSECRLQAVLSVVLVALSLSGFL